ncbi:MAG: manganese efflux pump MntP family protein [Chloroflexota bacterium]
MKFFEVLLISVSMAMDAFAVCLGAGTSGRVSSPRPTFRLAFHFGLFQFIMPIIGWFAGRTIVQWIAGYDHWVAFGLLAFVGVRMIRSGLGPNREEQKPDPSRGWTLVMLSIAVSIDALAIGLSLALLQVTIWYPAVMIGLVTGLIAFIGLRLGSAVGRKFGQQMEIFGGILLIAIGVRIVLNHMLA